MLGMCFFENTSFLNIKIGGKTVGIHIQHFTGGDIR